jgi:hypothetical protein
VDKEPSYRLLKIGGIRRERESTVVAAQDQAIGTNYFKKKKLNVDASYVKNMKKLLTT